MAGALLLAFTVLECAAALPDEIEVFDDSLAKVGRTENALHINTSPHGRRSRDFPGEIVPDKTWRTMLEISHGVSDGLEIGLHVPLLTERGGAVVAAGLRPRLRWIPIRPGHGFEGSFYGFNLEYSDIDRRLERPARHLEWKPIAGWRGTNWLIAANPGLTVWLSDAPKPNPLFALNAMVKRRFSENLIGLEFYSDYGPLGAFRPADSRDRMLFLAGDFEIQKFRLNAGIGRGLTPHSDHTIVKAILTFPY